AIQQITTERGEDPRGAAIIAFGGAGPLFGGLLARELGVQRVVIPNAAGNFSAWGLLCEDVARSAARTLIRPLGTEALAEAEQVLAALFSELDANSSSSELGEQLREPALDLRYAGQEHTLTVQLAMDDGHLVATPEQVAELFSEQHE